jgi:hypothetical protein
MSGANTTTNNGDQKMGLRAVERTNSWLANLGELRWDNSRRIAHRLTELSLAVSLLSPGS